LDFGAARQFRGQKLPLPSVNSQRGTDFPNHKIFDKQAKTATTNGVFRAKILQINIVQNGHFFYYFYNSTVTQKLGFSDSIYGKKF
jgi:hypothetical protein